MFNAKAAFFKLNGRWSYTEFRAKVVEIRIRHLQELPPEYTVDLLIDFADKAGWLRWDGSVLTCDVPE